MVPSPLPVLIVTVYVSPEPLTLVMDAPVTPVVVRSKSSYTGPTASRPVTDSENVTVKPTLDADVGLVLTRTLDETVGTKSTVTLTGEPNTEETFPAASFAQGYST